MRTTIYQEIETERQTQDKKWGGAHHDDQHNAAEWFIIIAKHSVAAWSSELSSARRRAWIRVAALAIAAVEAIDRAEGEI